MTRPDAAEVCGFGSRRLDPKQHISFLKLHLQALPYHYVSFEVSRLTAVQFCVLGLELCGWRELDKETTIQWIYHQQCSEGFVNGTSLPKMASEVHLASIYSALCTLLSLRDSLKVVNRSGILSTVKSLQQEDGSFKPYVGSLERDMRFTYCAIAIAYILGGLSTLNLDAARAFIMASKSYDGAFGQEPGCESHGGFTYCAIASLVLMDGTGFDPGRHRDTLDWCIRQHRPLSGFSGRLGKPADTCYSFWIGATIEMLGGLELVDHGVILDFLSAAAHERGGFGKMVGDPPDLLHTYFSLVAMGIMRRYHDLPVSGIYGPLGISAESFEHLKSLSVSSPSQPS